MTEVINKLSALKAKVEKKPKSSPVETKNTSTQASTQTNKKINNNAQQTVKAKPSKPITESPNHNASSSSACGFGGMKKGFLAAGLESKKQTSGGGKFADSSVALSADMPHIKSNPSKGGDRLVLQEVQKMRDQLQKTGNWFSCRP